MKASSSCVFASVFTVVVFLNLRAEKNFPLYLQWKIMALRGKKGFLLYLGLMLGKFHVGTRKLWDGCRGDVKWLPLQRDIQTIFNKLFPFTVLS